MMKNNKLFALMASNKKRGEFKAEGNTIFIYDMIVGSDAEAEFWGGVSPEAFAKTLSGMTGDVSLRINSPGGDVFGGRSIATAIKAYKGGAVTAYVDGYAASIASIIAVAADKVVMAEGSFMMIHKAWSIALGNADDFIAMAGLLQQIDVSITETYASKSGKAKEYYDDLLAAETWYSADGAVAEGLADEVAKDTKPSKKAAAKWDLSAYEAAPVVETPEPDEPEPSPQDNIGQRVRAHSARMLSLTTA
jgi:ATP-dependent Clp protease, protease subunit